MYTMISYKKSTKHLKDKKLELKNFEILAAERLRLMRFNNQLIINQHRCHSANEWLRMDHPWILQKESTFPASGMEKQSFCKSTDESANNSAKS